MVHNIKIVKRHKGLVKQRVLVKIGRSYRIRYSFCALLLGLENSQHIYISSLLTFLRPYYVMCLRFRAHLEVSG